MHVIRQLFEIDASSYSLDRDAERSIGCHVSKVIEYMCAKRYPERTDEATQAGWFGGFTLERVLARHAIEAELENNRAGLWKPGELFWCYNCHIVLAGKKAAVVHCRNRGHVGIYLTPDAVLVRQWMLKEWKLTKKSMRSAGGDELAVLGSDIAAGTDGLFRPMRGTDIERERTDYEHISIGMFPWIVQIKSYCWAISKLYDRLMSMAVLESLFVNGDYGLTTRDYTTARYWFRFGERELDEGWDSVVAHAIDGELLEVA